MATTNHFHTGSTHLIRQTPLLVQTSLPWRSPPQQHPSPFFKPLLIRRQNPLFETSSLQWRNPKTHTTNPFKFSLNSDTRNEYPDRVKDLMDTIFNAVKELQKKPAIALVLILALLFSSPYSALAASGGRMGGRSSSSLSSSSSSSSSSPSYGSSYYSYSSSTTSYDPKSNSAAGNSSSSYSFSDWCLIMIFLIFISFVIAYIYYSWYEELETQRAINTTVLKLQVGLLGSARSLQRDLNEIAETTDTSTSKGLSFILTETVVALLRHPDYFTSAFSSGDDIKSYEGAEKRFNELSIEERGKLDEETLVNVNNTRKQHPTSKSDDGSSNDYIVITILLEAGGSHKLPVINGCQDLKDALQKLGSIPCSQIRAVEVIWTPQDEKDTLSEQEVVEDYPFLKPIF